MSFNATKAVELSLDVFGSLVTEMTATDLPPGTSPDCQDVMFVPGSVSSRWGLQRILAPLPGAAAINYAKSYVDPTGVIRNLYLDSLGNLYVENFSTAPGVTTLLASTTPGSYAKSITAFGREYLAISDGLHGSEVALQYDGTNLDRVTQDGPGASPSIVSLLLPSVAMTVTGAASTYTIAAIAASDQTRIGPPFAQTFIWISFTVTLSAATLNITPGQYVEISGNTNPVFNQPWTVTTVLSPTQFKCGAYFTSLQTGVNGTVTGTGGITMTRSGNVVTVSTSAAHQLQPGFRIQITGVPAQAIGAGVSSIVIDNKSLPGRATVNTVLPHGLVPGEFVTLTGIVGIQVGGGITSLVRQGGAVTVTTAYAHGLTPGASVTIAGPGLTITGASNAAPIVFTTAQSPQAQGFTVFQSVTVSGASSGYNGTFRITSIGTNTVMADNTAAPGVPWSFGGTIANTSFSRTAYVVQVTSPNTFTYLDADADGVAAGGTVTLNWPVPDSATPNYYEVVAAPTATSFQVQVNYSDGTWTSGAVSFEWNGTFFVLAAPTSTTVQYQQYGPDATTTAVGTVTPNGQASPGQHQMQVLFLTRQGYLTRGSPPIKFVANGGQYLSVTDLPIGPSNVVARVLAFTGALGAFFFYIPVAPQINGQLVGTATQINDNTSTSVLLDFSDNTLFASLGISIQGNNLANQLVLDGALGFNLFDSRLVVYGQRNRLQSLLNLSFDGGYLPSAPTLPTGWILASGVGALAAGRFGQAWSTSASSVISQNAYQDSYGAPIIHPNTAYTFRAWASGVGTVTATLSSVSTAFTSTVTRGVTVGGGWIEGAFNLKIPTVVPTDLLLSITSAGAILLDEVSIIYSETPYLDRLAYGSYLNNPEAFDGLSGKFGPIDDTRKLMGMGIVRGNLYMLTRDPSGRLHETSANGVTEPSGWTINEVGANCGLLSTFGLTVSQADDATAGGGEEWIAWASSSGARIFGGDQPWKISQEIQPNWTGDLIRGFAGLNFAAALTIWALNDPVARVIYFGVPSLDVSVNPTAPNLILPVNYRQLDSASQIGTSAPVHNGLGGKLLSTDHTRKWTRWNVRMNGAALMYRAAGRLSPVFFGGNGGAGLTFGNVYQLSAAKLTDDDYGLIVPYYVSYAFPSEDQESSLQLGAHRKTLQYFMEQVEGVGQVTVTALCNTLTNPWPLNCVRPLVSDPPFDLEWAGASATAQRMFIKTASSPVTGTDNSFVLQKIICVLKPTVHLPVRGTSA